MEFEIVNRTGLEYFGATLEELRDRELTDTLHPDDVPVFLATWGRSNLTGEPYEIEARRRRADGAHRWFHMHGFPLRDTEGQIVYWFLLERDFDDRKQDEALLAGEKRMLEMVALGEPLPIVLDALCRLVEEISSGCYCSVFLIDPIGPRLAPGAAPSLPENFTTAIWGLPVSLESGPCGMAAYLNEQVIAPDVSAEARWKVDSWCALAMEHGLRACWSTPIASRAGTVLGTFAILFDEPATPTALHRGLIERFTHLAGIAIERAQGESALRRSEAFLAEAQKLSLTGSFGWSVSTDEHFWSAETFRIFEYDASTKVTLRLILDRVHPQDVALVRQVIAMAAEGNEFDYECRLLMPGGTVKQVHIVAHALNSKADQREFVGAVMDITASRRDEEALRSAQADLAHASRVTTLGELTASIAHEVNQPLTAVCNNANPCLDLLNSAPHLQEVRDALGEILDDADRASAVIARVRQLATKAPSQRMLLSIKEVVGEVLVLARFESSSRRVGIFNEVPEELPAVLGDRIQLQQVLLNLVTNRMDAMSGLEDSKRILSISGRREMRDGMSGCLVRIQDAGSGLGVAELDRLFESFYTTKPHRMGMGPAISRSIIEAHGGGLWAEANPDAGASFLFHLPAASEASP